ncbi:DUF4166 domain-containing protein [Microbacterium sp.]|uniref:DUF4166 domain-containing protein n=1 Tax=Microbacterium sp. TaxID=51671 RepID=UPI003A8EDB63
MRRIARSPYEQVLGERLHDLHPKLQQYFSTIPEGHLGVGEGIFRSVGTPRRWLWPLLRPLHRRGIVYAGWQLHVPFRVTNELIAGRMVSDREFLLPGQPWTMRDAVVHRAHGRLVDELGDPAVVAASFDVAVDDGALSMVSHTVGIRWGRLRIRIPRLIAPTVQLTERFDDGSERQQVSVTIDMPLIGRLYEYSGDFTYRIVEAA